MSPQTWFEKELEKAKDTLEFKLNTLELEITEGIIKEMEKKSITRTELAERLGVSKAYISKFLNYGSNVTIKKLIEIAHALDCDVDIPLKPKKIEVRKDLGTLATIRGKRTDFMSG